MGQRAYMFLGERFESDWRYSFKLFLSFGFTTLSIAALLTP